MKKIGYRRLPVYKYQLIEAYEVGISIRPGEDINTDFIKLSKDGLLWISARYAWDGPSGPTIDTKNFMRGSLVHDALYQLMREKQLPFEMRDKADRELQKICLEDGMTGFRAWYVYQGVHLFGAKNTRPQKKETKLIYAP